jgi:hypothetical protein
MATSITRGHAWNGATVDSGTMTPLLPADDGGVDEVLLRCDAASAASLRVGIVNQEAIRNKATKNTIHQVSTSTGLPTEYFVLAAGESIPFSAPKDNRLFIYVEGNGGTATFSGSVLRV